MGAERREEGPFLSSSSSAVSDTKQQDGRCPGCAGHMSCIQASLVLLHQPKGWVSRCLQVDTEQN